MWLLHQSSYLEYHDYFATSRQWNSKLNSIQLQFRTFPHSEEKIPLKVSQKHFQNIKDLFIQFQRIIKN